MRITNAGQCSFPNAFTGYSAYASYNRQYWFKVPTGYDTESGVLTIQHTPKKVCTSKGFACSNHTIIILKIVTRVQSRD
jgi:hypothetical protein